MIQIQSPAEAGTTNTNNKTNTTMAKTLTMRIPDAIYNALKVEGADLEQEPGEVVKTFLHRSYKQEGGATLNLIPILAAKAEASQAELPFT